jgi:hypothetical protein
VIHVDESGTGGYQVRRLGNCVGNRCASGQRR